MHCSQEEGLQKTRLPKSRSGIQDRYDQTSADRIRFVKSDNLMATV